MTEKDILMAVFVYLPFSLAILGFIGLFFSLYDKYKRFKKHKQIEQDIK